MREPGFEAELAGDFRQLRERHPFAIDQIAPPHRADLGIDPVLHAHPEQAGEAGFRGNERGRRSIGWTVNNDFRLPPLAGLGARPVRYWLFGLHVLLQRGRAPPVPPDALGLILIKCWLCRQRRSGSARPQRLPAPAEMRNPGMEIRRSARCRGMS
jgi:hypothetical protein